LQEFLVKLEHLLRHVVIRKFPAHGPLALLAELAAALRIAKQLGQGFGEFLGIIGGHEYACAGGVD